MSFPIFHAAESTGYSLSPNPNFILIGLNDNAAFRYPFFSFRTIAPGKCRYVRNNNLIITYKECVCFIHFIEIYTRGAIDVPKLGQINHPAPYTCLQEALFLFKKLFQLKKDKIRPLCGVRGHKNTGAAFSGSNLISGIKRGDYSAYRRGDTYAGNHHDKCRVKTYRCEEQQPAIY